MAKATLNGIEIDYEVTGRGRAVLMSHGYSATRRMWSGQHRFLGDRYRLLSWSAGLAIGHLLQPDPEPLARLRADKQHLVGL